MGILGLLRKQPPKPKRGKGRSPEQRLAYEKLNFLRQLKREDPELYKAKMLEEMNMTPKSERNQLKELKDMVEQLRDMGFIDSGKDLDNTSWVKDAMAGLPYLLPYLTGQAGQAVHPPIAAPAPIPERPALSQPEPEPEPAYQPPLPGTEPETPNEKVVHMSLTSRFIIMQVQNNSPEEAAEMLINAQGSIIQAREIVQGFCHTPNTEIPQFIQQTLTKYPDLEGFFAWLMQRPEWFRDCILAVRTRMGAGETTRPAAPKRASGL